MSHTLVSILYKKKNREQKKVYWLLLYPCCNSFLAFNLVWTSAKPQLLNPYLNKLKQWKNILHVFNSVEHIEFQKNIKNKTAGLVFFSFSHQIGCFRVKSEKIQIFKTYYAFVNESIWCIPLYGASLCDDCPSLLFPGFTYKHLMLCIF